jgi:hypothetical protein
MPSNWPSCQFLKQNLIIPFERESSGSVRSNHHLRKDLYTEEPPLIAVRCGPMYLGYSNTMRNLFVQKSSKRRFSRVSEQRYSLDGRWFSHVSCGLWFGGDPLEVGAEADSSHHRRAASRRTNGRQTMRPNGTLMNARADRRSSGSCFIRDGVGRSHRRI